MLEVEKLKNIIDEIDSLLPQNVTWSSPSFQGWYSKAGRWLKNQFGEDSYELNDFRRIQFQSMLFDEQQRIIACARGLEQAKSILSSYIDDLDSASGTMSANTLKHSKVFVVHGHDGELKQAVARIIEKQGIEAVILSEQVSQGKTIIEKIENYSDVGGAICLFTADDFGRSKSDVTENLRARQNVIFETGYFIGRLGRDRIVILADEDIEIPSDLSGIVHTNTANWQTALLKELKTIGYEIDFNLLF
ncbi:MAG: TIR domain-containing protein [Saccharofermentanales bacterium]|jgi:predicted nucleotide-binding protein